MVFTYWNGRILIYDERRRHNANQMCHATCSYGSGRFRDRALYCGSCLIWLFPLLVRRNIVLSRLLLRRIRSLRICSGGLRLQRCPRFRETNRQVYQSQNRETQGQARAIARGEGRALRGWRKVDPNLREPLFRVKKRFPHPRKKRYPFLIVRGRSCRGR